MESIIIAISKYIICLLITVYTLYCFIVFRRKDKRDQRWVFRFQNTIMFLTHGFAYVSIYLGQYTNEPEAAMKLILFYLIQVIVFLLTLLIYRISYRKLSQLVLNNMLMLIIIGTIMQTRLNLDSAIRHFFFICVGLLGCLIVPVIIKKIKYLKDFGWFYGIFGLLCLMLVFVIGQEKYGAKNWIVIGSFAMQPSEFVKIVFVFFAAACLSKATEFKDIVRITILAATHVLVLVLAKDLGGALIFFITYLIMLYIATSQPLYLFTGLGAGSIASVAAYYMFNHVRVRVTAWRDPWSVIANQGYQITQSLFAIGTGGWFGMGLTKGGPSSIPVVESDFIFSAISEEMGGIVAVCLILICMSCFIMFINISMKMKKEFYKLIALGLSVMYMFQVFLMIGGVTKFIPSTGVTLPLVSSGGSSVLSTIILFSIIQGLYVLNQDEVDAIEREKRERIKEKQIQTKTATSIYKRRREPSQEGKTQKNR